MNQMLNARQLAERLGVSRATVHAWQRRGWIPCLRAGRKPVLFDPVEVEQALRLRARQIQESRHDA